MRLAIAIKYENHLKCKEIGVDQVMLKRVIIRKYFMCFGFDSMHTQRDKITKYMVNCVRRRRRWGHEQENRQRAQIT